MVPADNKWFTRVIVASAVIDTLARLNLSYPRVDKAKLEEIAKAKLMSKKAIVAGREKCDQLAAQVGEEELFANDASRVNTTVDQLFAVTAADVQRVAAKYLQPQFSNALTITLG